MGLFLKQNEPRSQLQSKVAADLAERMNKRALETNDMKPQPAFLDNQRQTSPLAWVWMLLGLIAVVGIIFGLTSR
jgi:hypothetical protein